MKKTLVIFYSRTGTTKKVGEEIAKSLNSDIEEIIDKKNRSGAIGWLGAGKDAMKNKLTEINGVTKNPSDYDTIIIGTPVWGGSISPAIRTYITINREILSGKKLAFFSTCGSSVGKSFVQMQELIGKNPSSSLSLLTKEVKDNNYNDKLNKFIEEIKKA
jgi:flavodoxin